MQGAPINKSRPAIELQYSQPSDETMQRVTRVMLDVQHLAKLTTPQARAVYQHLEATRDVLSVILDRANGKDR